MVKKLLKHEFVYYFRTFGLFLPIVLAIGLMTRIFWSFSDNGNVISQIAIGSSTVMFVVACAALILLAEVVAVVRFYKNMYSSEGYLTFTLPVTNDEHIFVKLFTATVCQIVCILTVVISAVIAIPGETFREAVKAIGEAMNDFFSLYGVANAIAFILETVILLLLSAVGNTLLFYACITVGQTAKKNRILMAFGAYFIYYVATQMLSTVFVIIVMILEMSGALEVAEVWLEGHEVFAIHLYLCGTMVISAAWAAVYWFVTKYIMTKKLNLE